VASKEKAQELSQGGPVVKILGYGQARARTGYLGESTVVSARAALDATGLDIHDLAAVKTHNPFAVHDVYFAQQFDLKWEDFNNHGSSLVYGHPNGATGMRMVIELVEELVDRGGGRGMFSGCAAGDTGGAIVVEVADA
jgi:acetyl-CoA acetyltransferase